MTRSGGALVAAMLLVSSAQVLGCDGDGEPAPSAATPAVDTERIAEAEDDLLARRDALLSLRTEIREKREELVERRRQVSSEGGDTSEIDAALASLEERARDADRQASELFDRLESHLDEQRRVLAAAAGAGEDVTSREASLAARERDLARREERLGQREASLSQRETELADKWKESCQVAGPATTIVRTVDAPGSRYTRKDVEPLLGRARREMSRRGILASDLPAPARGLEKEATAAMAEGDYGRARFAASQLLGTVRSTRIDKGFIAAKIARLNRDIRGKSLDGGTQETVDTLFREATANYGDGKFGQANGRLNQIYGAIR